MVGLLEQNRAAIAQLCMKFGVDQLEVFGSAAREKDFNAQSDFDFLVRFNRKHTLSPFYQYFDFKEALELLLGRSVDLVEIGAIQNPYFLRAIEPERRLLYAA